MKKNDTNGILEARIRQMANGNFTDNGFTLADFDPEPHVPVQDTDGQTGRKPRKNGYPKKSDKQTDMTISEYESMFLTNRQIDYRTSFPMNRITLDILRNILRDLESRTSLSSFIENILLDHLQTYRTLINTATEEKIRKPTIPTI